MSFTCVLTEPTGKVRLLIPDRVAEEAIFTDGDIAAFLELEDGNIKRAAAQAIDTVSNDEALVQKVGKTLGLETNGAATAKALMQRAEALRSQADKAELKAEEGADDGLGGFAIAEAAVDDFSARELFENEYLRGDY